VITAIELAGLIDGQKEKMAALTMDNAEKLPKLSGSRCLATASAENVS
jgi:hypothetical protein